MLNTPRMTSLAVKVAIVAAVAVVIGVGGGLHIATAAVQPGGLAGD
jgi:hypothetical protein